MKTPCLVVIDVQEKLFPVIHNGKELLENLDILIKGFKLFDLPIIVTEQVPEKLGSTIEPIRSLLSDIDPISKSFFSCAKDAEFMESANAIERSDGFVLAGIETHVCVYQTACDMIQNDEHVEVVSDAVASRDQRNHHTALERIKDNGGFLTTVEMILFHIQKDARGDKFRKLVSLVK
tara:strand:- start:149 stop:682 length:534 start_codon:yes stop_codon:yes gene_type:complete